MQQIAVFELAEWTQLPTTPCILVLTNDTTIQNEAVGYSINTLNDVTIIVADRDQDQGQLRRKMYRYTAAIIECLSLGRVATGLSGWGSPVASYSPIYVTAGNPFEADAHVNTKIFMQESLS